MSYMPYISNAFFTLLAAALNGREVPPERIASLSEEDWKKVFYISREQAVTALLYDVVSELPQELLPPRDLLINWFVFAQKTEQSNRKVLSVEQELLQAFQEMDIPLVIYKGHSGVELYPHPLHRTPGDIDHYLPYPEQFDRCIAWARRHASKIETKGLHHQGFHFAGVAVEAHFKLATFQYGKYDLYLAEEVETLLKKRPIDTWPTCSVEGQALQMLPETFNSIAVFGHLLHHFVRLGIGLRQVCDWLMHCKGRKDKIEAAEHKRLADRFAYTHPMYIFAALGVKYLGFEAKDFPFDVTPYLGSPLVEVLKEDILRAGNFGYNAFSGRRFRSRWHRRWHSYRTTLRRIRNIKPIAPEHTRPMQGWGRIKGFLVEEIFKRRVRE